MKFKLDKSEHYNFFNVLKSIEKLNLNTKENKQSDNSLVFLNHENNLTVYVSNGISSAYFNLKIDILEDEYFAVDLNLFCSAFQNFPSNEINFVYQAHNNLLIFGNKKTKVSLKTSMVDNIDQIENFIEDENKYFDYDFLYDALKYTKFSCSSIIEEYPYSSIMLTKYENQFGARSSDKHRISIFNDLDEQYKSFLISRQNADVLMDFIKKLETKNCYIDNNKLSVKNSFGKFSTSLENNTFESTFDKFKSFIENSKSECKFTLNKNTFLKSIKFISSISVDDVIDITLSGNQVMLSCSSNDKGVVADKITVLEDLPDLSITYAINHFTKALDVFEQENIKCEILNYNQYHILKLSNNRFYHIIFPFI